MKPHILATDLEDGTEIEYYEKIYTTDHRIIMIHVQDYITTMSHPLNGRQITGPSTIVAKIFARWDHVIGHENMAEHITRQMEDVE